MDLKQFEVLKSETPTRLELKHPGTLEVLTFDNGEAMFINLLSKDSPAFLKAKRRIIDKRLLLRKKTLSAEQLEADATELLLAVISGGRIFLEGAEVEINSGNARAILERFPFIREQIDAFLEDRSNFLQK